MNSPFRETDDTIIFSFSTAASRIHTCALVYSEDSVFRHEHQRTLVWDSRPKRFLHLRVDCSLHSHIFTLRVNCPLRLPLTRVSLSWFFYFILRLSINLFPFNNPPPPFFVLLDRANERLRNTIFHLSLSTLIVHPVVCVVDENWFGGIPVHTPTSTLLVYSYTRYICVFVYFCFPIYSIFCPSPLRNQQPSGYHIVAIPEYIV